MRKIWSQFLLKGYNDQLYTYVCVYCFFLFFQKYHFMRKSTILKFNFCNTDRDRIIFLLQTLKYSLDSGNWKVVCLLATLSLSLLLWKHFFFVNFVEWFSLLESVHVYRGRKIIIIRLRTLKFSLDSSNWKVVCLLATLFLSLSFAFKTFFFFVSFIEWFSFSP